MAFTDDKWEKLKESLTQHCETLSDLGQASSGVAKTIVTEVLDIMFLLEVGEVRKNNTEERKISKILEIETETRLNLVKKIGEANKQIRNNESQIEELKELLVEATEEIDQLSSNKELPLIEII